MDQKEIQQDVKSPAPKALKKTMTFSRFDFGGIIEPTLGTCPRKDPNDMELSEEKYKWKSTVKCLFDGSDLKQSIHCGPELRAESTKIDFLTGFGR
jgi:hypothetical protein